MYKIVGVKDRLGVGVDAVWYSVFFIEIELLRCGVGSFD